MLRADDSAVGLPQRAAIGLIRLYKILLSPLFAGSCRFVPSCSDYAREAIREYGVIRGAWLAARRLGRCHPLGSSGVDPVPLRLGSGQALRLGSGQALRLGSGQALRRRSGQALRRRSGQALRRRSGQAPRI